MAEVWDVDWEGGLGVVEAAVEAIFVGVVGGAVRRGEVVGGGSSRRFGGGVSRA